MKRLCLVLLAACGGGDSPADPDGPAVTPDGPGETDGPTTPDGPAAAIMLTSTAYAEGGTIPAVHSCENPDNNGVSPPLAWANVPAGTLSFAIVFTDKTNMLRHSMIYDIPANVTSLPLDVDAGFSPADVPGAHQTRNFRNQNDYAGPCPNNTHTYEFAIYALDVAALPNMAQNTSAENGETQALMHDLAKGTLTATFTPN